MTRVSEYRIYVDVTGGIHVYDDEDKGHVFFRPGAMLDILAALNDAMIEGRRKQRIIELRAKIGEMEVELAQLEEMA